VVEAVVDKAAAVAASAAAAVDAELFAAPHL
jgi:hypothetical protein